MIENASFILDIFLESLGGTFLVQISKKRIKAVFLLLLTFINPPFVLYKFMNTRTSFFFTVHIMHKNSKISITAAQSKLCYNVNLHV